MFCILEVKRGDLVFFFSSRFGLCSEEDIYIYCTVVVVFTSGTSWYSFSARCTEHFLSPPACNLRAQQYGIIVVGRTLLLLLLFLVFFVFSPPTTKVREKTKKKSVTLRGGYRRLSTKLGLPTGEHYREHERGGIETEAVPARG